MLKVGTMISIILFQAMCPCSSGLKVKVQDFQKTLGFLDVHDTFNGHPALEYQHGMGMAQSVPDEGEYEKLIEHYDSSGSVPVKQVKVLVDNYKKLKQGFFEMTESSADVHGADRKGKQGLFEMTESSARQKNTEGHWVWFEHFSRAGGKTMDVNAFINGFKGYGKYDSEQPWRSESQGTQHRRHQHMEMNADQLYNFHSRHGSNYVSNEDGPLDFLGMEEHIKLKKITIMREPKARLKSCAKMGHDMRQRRYDNEYVRRLLGDGSGKSVPVITRDHFEQAKKVLSTFDVVAIFEDFDASFDLLRCKLQWCVVTDFDGHDHGNGFKNSNTTEFEKCRRLSQRDMELMSIFTKAMPGGPPETKDQPAFNLADQIDTTYDDMLYKFAKNLSQQQRAGCK